MQMATAVETADGWLTCTSPDGNVAIGFASDADGMCWRLARNGQTLVAPSRLGLSFSIFKGNGRELAGALPRRGRHRGAARAADGMAERPDSMGMACFSPNKLRQSVINNMGAII